MEFQKYLLPVESKVSDPEYTYMVITENETTFGYALVQISHEIQDVTIF